jgi:hypothetical protein
VSLARSGNHRGVAVFPARDSLLTSDGFRVESAGRRLGAVEEVWLDERGEPTGIAVRTEDGRRGLVLAADVVAVDPGRRRVVVAPAARVLELAPPRLRERAGRLEASWATTGEAIEVQPSGASPPSGPTVAGEPSLLRTILVLYAGLALVVIVIIALSFGIPYLAR